jgi:phytoene dehydrogenase-like protein
MTGPRYDAIVIGGGANGLVAAARLGQAGLSVLVVEKAESVGGQGGVAPFAPGFRAAPLALDPGWLPPRIAKALGLAGLEPVAQDTPLSVAAGPGAILTLSRDPVKAAEAIGRHSRVDAAKWGSFTAQLRALAGFLEVLYQAPAPDVDVASLRDLLPLLTLGRKFRALGRRDMIEFLRTLPLSVWELLDDWFECAPLKAAIATGGIQDFQQGPRSGGTGFVLLHHLVGAPAGSLRGRVPWRGGPAAFTDAALAAAQRSGVAIRTGAPVVRIDVRDDAVTGVVLAGGEEIASRTLLSTVDPARTLLEWIDPVWLDPELVRAFSNVRHRGCTAFVLYGLATVPRLPGLAAPEALSGLVSLTADLASLERAADAAKYGTVSERPHVELTVPSLLWPALAPAGRHVAVARVQYAPYRLKDAAWDAGRLDALVETVTSTIEAVAPGFTASILHREGWSPRDLEERFGLREGAATQGELALDQILFMRPVAGWGRHTTPISGLYLGGAGTHPGPGVLGGAGWLAAARALEGPERGR